MKNRLQFNRIPALFASGVTYLSGTTIGVSGREKATEALEAFVKRRDFIPLIGEPIVVRYIDDKGKKQAMLAIGKATGSTENDTRGIEYHIIDTAKLQEDIDLANEHAAEALDLASAATHDIANHLVILKNMIGENGIFMEDGSFFDGESDDPSKVGLYKNWSGNPVPYETTYISAATNMFEADLMLDAAIKEQSVKIDVLSGVTQETIDSLNELWEAASALSAATVEFSANTVNEFEKVKSDIVELSATTESFSAGTSSLFESIIEGTGLNNGERGSYASHDETHIIKDATSLDNADVLLDMAVWSLSGVVSAFSANTVAAFDEFNDSLGELSAATIAIDEKVDELSANTMAADQVLGNKIGELSANTMAADEVLDNKIDELSANTMAADQTLQDQIDELGNRKVLGVSAITVETLENGDSKVSLVINEEDDKFLTQNALGLKTSVSLVYSREDKKIYLKGKNDATISTIDATDFIKDGMLSAASVFTATEADHEQYPELVVGKTYIKLLFNVDGEEPGRANPVFISAEDLVDIYSVDPESHTFMEINDYVIKLNVDKENGLASYNYARNISAVTANIISATGLNMGEQGGYPGHDETHYIKNAGSLDQADVLLDEALWAVSGMVVGFDERIDELEEDVTAIDNRLTLLSAVTAEFSATTDIKIAELSARTVDLSEVYEYIDSGDTALKEHIDEVEEVIAGSLNDLNRRVGYFETHYTGEYIPLTGYEIASGLSEDELIIDDDDSVNEAFGKIQKQILDNEEAVAAGINDLFNRTEENARAIAAENSAVTILSAAVVSFSAATTNKFDEVNNNITNIQNNITWLRNDVSGLSAFTQFLSGHSLGVLTVNLNGVEQGKYCPSASTTLNLEAIQEVTGADVLLTGYELSTGTTEEELAIVATDTVNEAFGKVQKQVYDNEAVIAGALNDLNGRVIELSAATISLSGSVFNGVNYDTNTKRINFYNGSRVVDYVDATEFIKDGMLDDVRVITSGGEQYLSFIFNTDSGKETINIKVSDFAALYTAGNGISISSENAIGLKLANKGDTSFIGVDGDGLYLTGISAMGNSITNLSGSVVTNKNNITALSAATTGISTNLAALSAACVTMSGNINDNRTDINILSASIIDDELVIAAALNDLNRRVVEISGNTGGDITEGPQGTFTTSSTVNNITFSTFLSIIQTTGHGTGLPINMTVGNSSDLPKLPANGVREAHVIIENNSTTDVALIKLSSSDTRLKLTTGDEIYIEPNGIGELNAMITYDGSNYTIYIITT